MSTPKKLILFDGECPLCGWIVRFAIKRDPRSQLLFAPLQSDVGRYVLSRRGLTSTAAQTVVLVSHSQTWTESDALLIAASALRAPWSLIGAAQIIPKCVRDPIYRLLARLRYSLYKSRACGTIPVEVKTRFLTTPSELQGHDIV